MNAVAFLFLAWLTCFMLSPFSEGFRKMRKFSFRALLLLFVVALVQGFHPNDGGQVQTVSVNEAPIY